MGAEGEVIFLTMRKIVFDIETSNIFRDVGKADPSLLDLAVVGVWDSENDAYSCYTKEELPNLWPILEKADTLIGWNSNHFDIPLLNKYYPGDLFQIKSIDLMAELREAMGRRLSLNSVASATLGKEKSGEGLQATKWWQEGEYEKVKNYCLDDVRLTKEVYDYALAHGALKYKDLGILKEAKMDTSSWEKKEDSGMTHTLPF